MSQCCNIHGFWHEKKTKFVTLVGQVVVHSLNSVPTSESAQLSPGIDVRWDRRSVLSFPILVNALSAAWRAVVPTDGRVVFSVKVGTMKRLRGLTVCDILSS